MAGSIGDLIMQLMGKQDPKQAIIEDALRRKQEPPADPQQGPPDPNAPPQTVKQGPLPESMKSPPDLAEMYMKLMERSQNAAALDRGLTTMAAGLAHEENRPALLQMAAGYGGDAGSGFGFDDIIKMREAAAAEQALVNRQAQLPALMKQYNLDPATVQYLDSTDALDEVVSALANPDTEVFEASDGSKKLINSKTGATIKELSAKKPRATEFVELADKSKVLVHTDDKTRVDTGKAITEIGAQQDIQVIQAADGSNQAYDKNSGKIIGTITEGDPNKGDWTLTRADGSSARYNSKNELIKELSPAKVERQIVQAADGANVLVQDGKVVGTVTKGDPHKGDFTVERADGSEARFNADGKVIAELSPAKVLNAEDKDTLADINKERKAAGEKPMTVEEFQTAFKKEGVNIYNDTKGNKIPAPPTDMVWKMDKDGNVVIGEDGAPIAIWVKGSPGEIKYLKDKLEADKAAKLADKAEESGAGLRERDVMAKSTVVKSLDDALGILNRNENEWLPAAGMGAGALAGLGIGGLSVNDLLSKLTTVSANSAFEQLKAMRASAAESGATSGASGLGQVTEKEHKMLSAVWGDMSINQGVPQLKDTIKRNRRAMQVLAFNDFPDTPEGMAAFMKAMEGYQQDPELDVPSSDALLEENQKKPTLEERLEKYKNKAKK